MSRFLSNSVLNYASQFYSMIIILVVTPLYLRYMGSEQYGLVALSTLIFTWLNLLDAGISPTLNREAAMTLSKRQPVQEFGMFLWSIERIFIGVTIILIILGYAFENIITENWINTESLSNQIVQNSLFLIMATVPVRLFSGFYKSGINGFEDQVLLNKILILFTTGKYLFPLLTLVFLSKNIVFFFLIQFILTIIESFVFRRVLFSNLKGINFWQGGFYWNSIKSKARFALQISYGSILWIISSQVDKLIYSHKLTLSEFGYFGILSIIIVTLSGFSQPILKAILPILIRTDGLNDKTKFISVFISASKIILIVITFAMLFLFINGKPFLTYLTGDANVANWIFNAYIGYSIAAAAIAIQGVLYYYQVVLGDLRLHTKLSTYSFLVDIPVVSLSAYFYDPFVTGYVFAVLRLFWLFFSSYFILTRFDRISFVKWTRLILKNFLLVCLIIGLLYFILVRVLNFGVLPRICLSIALIIFSFFNGAREFRFLRREF